MKDDKRERASNLHLFALAIACGAKPEDAARIGDAAEDGKQLSVLVRELLDRLSAKVRQ